MKRICLHKLHSMKRAIAAAVLCLIAAVVPLLALTSPCAAAGCCKTIYLTFDDGPTDSTTPHVLNILREKQVRATFFLIGRQICGREDIVRREADEGHAIGIHSQTHSYRDIYASADALLGDIEACRRSICKVLPAYHGTLYRFPGGPQSVSADIRAAVRKAGYTPCGWNASVGDADGLRHTAQDLLQNAIDSAAGKERIILLLHDGVGYRETVRCLPELIDEFRAQGYTFLPLAP